MLAFWRNRGVFPNIYSWLSEPTYQKWSFFSAQAPFLSGVKIAHIYRLERNGNKKSSSLGSRNVGEEMVDFPCELKFDKNSKIQLIQFQPSMIRKENRRSSWWSGRRTSRPSTRKHSQPNEERRLMVVNIWWIATGSPWNGRKTWEYLWWFPWCSRNHPAWHQAYHTGNITHFSALYNAQQEAR